MAKRPLKTLIVVADSARARFLRPQADKLVAAGPADMVAPQSRLRARALVSDGPGRGFSSARGGARHALESQHDYQKLEKRRFMAVLAEALGAAHGRGEFDELILVAPRRSLGELRGLLSEPVQGCIRELAKDLTNEPPSSLRRHLDPLLGTRLTVPARANAPQARRR